MKVIHFLNIYNLTGISEWPSARGPRELYSPVQGTVSRLPTSEMFAFLLECGKDECGKVVARKNQQDIRCFEADTFRCRLIDDLEINSSRVPLPSKNGRGPKPYSPV